MLALLICLLVNHHFTQPLFDMTLHQAQNSMNKNEKSLEQISLADETFYSFFVLHRLLLSCLSTSRIDTSIYIGLALAPVPHMVSGLVSAPLNQRNPKEISSTVYTKSSGCFVLIRSCLPFSRSLSTSF